jgi:hypothetical protein
MTRNILLSEFDENGDVILNFDKPSITSQTIKPNAKIKDHVDQIMSE